MQELLRASGLTYTMHSAGTTVEGSWDDVMRVVGQAHAVVHDMGVVRVQTSARIGTRWEIFLLLSSFFVPLQRWKGKKAGRSWR